MAKKNKGKVVQMLSPEKYIRQKARTLEIWECWVNTNWNESKMASVIVTRRHTNENITAGMYLVDLNCLGIKDSYFLFNVPSYEYTELLQKISAGSKKQKIEYTLAHNIIFAGLEFAEEYGFKPVKDFTATTKFILEEDDENIELVEIECGMNGKPAYMRGPNDTNAMVNKILAQLDKTAGEGNYSYVDNVLSPNDEDDELWDDEDENYDEEEDYDEDDGSQTKDLIALADKKWKEVFKKYEDYTIPQMVDMFKKLYENQNKLTTSEKFDYLFLTNILMDKLTDGDEVDRIFDQYEKQLEEFVLTEDYSPEFLGFENDSSEDYHALSKMFGEFFDATFQDTKTAKKYFKKMQQSFPDKPATAFADIYLLSRTKSDTLFFKNIQTYSKRFPHYPVFRILIDLINVDSPTAKELLNEGFVRYFEGRSEIHEIEFHQFFNMLGVKCMGENDPTSIQAVSDIVSEYNSGSDLLEMLESIINVFRIELLFINLDKLSEIN